MSTPTFRRMGAFAEYVTVPARIAYHLPDTMPFAQAALIEAVSVAVHAVSLTPIRLEDTLVVVGAGMIGMLALQAARQAGAGRVFVLDLDESRLAAARNLGATATFNAGDEASISQIIDLTAGRGADAVIECVGATAPVKLAIDTVRKGGTVTLVGNVTPTIEIGLQSGSDTPNSLTGLVRFVRRVSCLYFANGAWRDSSGALAHRCSAPRSRPVVVRPLAPPRAGLLKVVLEP